MRLRTFESFWLLKNGLLSSYPSLRHNDETTQIVVIGAGITGALISHALMEKGFQVMLIDKRDVALGSTAATTSMLQYEIDVPLYRLAEQIGEGPAAACYRAGRTAVQEFGRLVAETGIACGFERKNSLYLARSSSDAKWLKKEFELRDKHQLGVQWLTKKEILERFGMVSAGGILSDTAASADAYRFTHELIAYNVKRGMKVYDQTAIEKYDLKKEGATLQTDSGTAIHCDKVIFCTGFESVHMLKEKVADLFYTYACVSEKNISVPPALKKTLVWDTCTPYLYLRGTDDGRLLVGGEDSSTHHTFFQNRIKERKSLKLQKQLLKLLPGLEFVEDFSWGGTFGSTKDGLPYIGTSPEHESAYFVLGFGGNGITFSVQGMQIITDLLEGKENELARYYRFGR